MRDSVLHVAKAARLEDGCQVIETMEVSRRGFPTGFIFHPMEYTMKVGDVITLTYDDSADEYEDEPLFIRINGGPKFHLESQHRHSREEVWAAFP